MADNERVWKADGFDHCVIGIVLVPGESRERIVYDAMKCILTIQLSSGDECSFEEAQDYFEFNVLGSIIDGGPAYVYLKTLDEIESDLDHAGTADGFIPERYLMDSDGETVH